MPDSMTWRILARSVVLILGFVVVLISCAKDPVRVDRNRPPQTYLVAAPQESVAASYRIHLYWRGEDPDGYVAGFLWAWDDSTVGAFRYTTKTDSIFELAVNDSATLLGGTTQQQPSQTKAHTFYIRAVDNRGKADPNLTIFNRRIYNANTDRPRVRFVGAIPSGLAEIDTVCDHQPFSICWTGSDADGYVAYYKWDIGLIPSGLSGDTCATFNAGPGTPQLDSGVYTFTVTAIDNAFAPSEPAAGGRTLLVVNRDPETRIMGHGKVPGVPVGYYIQPYLDGLELPPQPKEFFEGETVPYRSTVYWYWDGFDAACDNPSKITGFSAVLRGTRDNFQQYVIGFRNFLCNDGPDPVYFTTNDPAVVFGKCSLPDLILDSLDAGHNMVFNVAARDSSGRADGTPAAFRFNCNFPPHIDSLWTESIMVGTVPSVRIRWTSRDYEDGFTKGSSITIDSAERIDQNTYEQELVLPESRFRTLSGQNPHSIEVYVLDRAGIRSEQTLTTRVNVTYPP
jgi:hypothetical protein